jgi:hypothetical protein
MICKTTTVMPYTPSGEARLQELLAQIKQEIYKKKVQTILNSNSK